MPRLLKAGLWLTTTGLVGSTLLAGGVCGPTTEMAGVLLLVAFYCLLSGLLLTVAAALRALFRRVTRAR